MSQSQERCTPYPIRRLITMPDYRLEDSDATSSTSNEPEISTQRGGQHLACQKGRPEDLRTRPRSTHTRVDWAPPYRPGSLRIGRSALDPAEPCALERKSPPDHTHLAILTLTSRTNLPRPPTTSPSTQSAAFSYTSFRNFAYARSSSAPRPCGTYSGSSHPR
jgi:hypothetical protein